MVAGPKIFAQLAGALNAQMTGFAGVTVYSGPNTATTGAYMHMQSFIGYGGTSLAPSDAAPAAPNMTGFFAASAPTQPVRAAGSNPADEATRRLVEHIVGALSRTIEADTSSRLPALLRELLEKRGKPADATMPASGRTIDLGTAAEAAPEEILGALAHPEFASRANLADIDRLAAIAVAGILGNASAQNAISWLAEKELPFSVPARAVLENRDFLMTAVIAPDAKSLLQLAYGFYLKELIAASAYDGAGGEGRSAAMIHAMAAAEGPLTAASYIHHWRFFDGAPKSTYGIYGWIQHNLDSFALALRSAADYPDLLRNLLLAGINASYDRGDLSAYNQAISLFAGIADEAARKDVHLAFERPRGRLGFALPANADAMSAAETVYSILSNLMKVLLEHVKPGALHPSLALTYELDSATGEGVITLKATGMELPAEAAKPEAVLRARVAMNVGALVLTERGTTSSSNNTPDGFEFTLRLRKGLMTNQPPAPRRWEQLAADEDHPLLMYGHHLEGLQNALVEIEVLGIRTGADADAASAWLAKLDPVVAPWVAATRELRPSFSELWGMRGDPARAGVFVRDILTGMAEGVNAMRAKGEPWEKIAAFGDAAKRGPLAVIDALLRRGPLMDPSLDWTLVDIVDHNLDRGRVFFNLLTEPPTQETASPETPLPSPTEARSLSVRDRLERSLRLPTIAAKYLGIDVEIDIPKNLSFAPEFSRGAFLDAIEELVGNAVKYHDLKPGARIVLRWDADRGVFMLRDNGSGIENTDKVWKRGFREDARHPRISGTGLGLDIVRRQIEDALGWQISLRSEIGQWTEFTITPKAGDVLMPPRATDTPE